MLMNISTLNLLSKDASKNLRNNATTSISSITSITSTLFVLGLFVLFMLNLRMGIIGIYSQYEVRLTLKDDIKITDQQNIYKKIQESNVVTDSTFENNTTLPTSYIIKANGQNDVPKIISQFKGVHGINKINSSQNIPNNILGMIKIIQWVGVILFLILMVATFFLIKNTIKLAIYPRINEINMMQYLGATDWYIRWKFIFEGIITGFLGSVVAVIVLYCLYIFAYRQANSYYATLFISFINPSFILTTISWSFIFIGIILTAIGNIFVIKKLLIV
ncbi:FtsX-like permease family protein (plasmid) [Clostridium estertheticum]|nr:FtsX-like permease family protein [Clostridium estertheticum]WLC86655.1 FtsX-like permease family protein [Clostridium estertheticum]